jgi:hypothetical protein
MDVTTVHWRVKIANMPLLKIMGPIAAPAIKTLYQQDLKLLNALIMGES